MILSVSRRTDIPHYYSEWFINRLKEGYLYVRNPMNERQVSRIALHPEWIDGIVFWTKNPQPMFPYLKELSGYPYYFQFTLTGYGKDMEPGIPHKKTHMLPIFQKLSGQIGSTRVIWRYDPILFDRVYTPDYHLKAFAEIAGSLRGYTETCVISFLDIYAKNKETLLRRGLWQMEEADLKIFAAALNEIAGENGITLSACAEPYDLTECGIKAASCIDKNLLERLAGCSLEAGKDKNQRAACGCMESIEVGSYDTCPGGCLYCYACRGKALTVKRYRAYDKLAPMLCGTVTEKDKITERKVRSLKGE